MGKRHDRKVSALTLPWRSRSSFRPPAPSDIPIARSRSSFPIPPVAQPTLSLGPLRNNFPICGSSRSSSRTRPARVHRSAQTSSRSRRPTATRCCSPIRRRLSSIRTSTTSSRSIRSRISSRSRSGSNCRLRWRSATRLPATTLADLLDYARTHPDALTYASPGVGNYTHVALEYLKHLAGVKIVHVPYRGTNQVMPDLLSGRVEHVPGHHQRVRAV